MVITGSGGSFSAGADIGGEDAHESFDVRALDAANRIIRAVTGCPKPVVAAVNGVAAGVGCSTALAADIIVASESATFLLAFTRVGLMPDGGASATRRRRDRPAPGDADGAARRAAHRRGGVRRRAGDPLARATTSSRRWSTSWSAGWPKGPRSPWPPPSGRSTRPRSTSSSPPSSASAPTRPILLRTDDVAEGMRAFNEQRRPDFRGS